jgi:hypothetical protein
MRLIRRCCLLLCVALPPAHARGEGDWEITPESEAALERGLAWLARHQGPEGNWESNDLGLVGMGALAFLAAGHTPGQGQYGDVVERALAYVLEHAQPSGFRVDMSKSRHSISHRCNTSRSCVTAVRRYSAWNGFRCNDRRACVRCQRSAGQALHP